MKTVNVHVGIQHGDDCTCTRLDPINIQPVIVGDDCPGPRDSAGHAREQIARVAGQIAGELGIEVPQPYPGRVILTWPPIDRFVAPSWGVAVHDADTGDLVPTVALDLHLGEPELLNGPLTVALKLLVDADGAPLIGDRITPVWDDGGEGRRVKTGVFTCPVAAMRVRGDGKLSLNEERAILGLGPIEYEVAEMPSVPEKP